MAQELTDTSDGCKYLALRQHVRDFLYALDRGYFHCDKTEFVDALRREVR